MKTGLTGPDHGQPAQRLEIRFPGTHEGFAAGFVRARRALDAVRLDAPTRYNAELVFEEIVANIVGHGAPDGHALEVSFVLETGVDSIVLTFDDNGMPFDPRGRPDPPPQKSLDEARIGGYGLVLVRHAASSLDYLRTADGHNRLIVTLPLRSPLR